MNLKFKDYLQKIDTKKFILSLVALLLLIILCFLGFYLYEAYAMKLAVEKSSLSFVDKNKETVFSIKDIVFFSSCDSKNKTSSKSNFTIENLYSYTDIALFIDSYPDENSLENTLKEVSISNIKFSKAPSIGEPKLYFKDLNNFASSTIVDENLINNELKFEITAEDTADFSKPILFNNCANPIVLSYVNENIKTDYTITDTSNPITYNGSLLNRCNVSLDSLATSISFDIFITNNKDEKFRTNVFLDIPYEYDGKSILDGSLTVKKEESFDFYRYE